MSALLEFQGIWKLDAVHSESEVRWAEAAGVSWPARRCLQALDDVRLMIAFSMSGDEKQNVGAVRFEIHSLIGTNDLRMRTSELQLNGAFGEAICWLGWRPRVRASYSESSKAANEPVLELFTLLDDDRGVLQETYRLLEAGVLSRRIRWNPSTNLESHASFTNDRVIFEGDVSKPNSHCVEISQVFIRPTKLEN